MYYYLVTFSTHRSIDTHALVMYQTVAYSTKKYMHVHTLIDERLPLTFLMFPGY